VAFSGLRNELIVHLFSHFLSTRYIFSSSALLWTLCICYNESQHTHTHTCFCFSLPFFTTILTYAAWYVEDLCCMICWNHCYIFLLKPSHDTNWSTVLHCCLPFLQLASCSFFDTVFVFTVTFPSQSELHNFRNLARKIIIIIHPQGVASVEQAFRKRSTIAVTFWRVFGNKGWVQNGFLTNINR